MRNHEHRARAEQLLDSLQTIQGKPWFEPGHGQVMATMALAHATLALGQQDLSHALPINQQEPKIAFQGPAAAQRVECVRLAAEEANRTTPECGTVFTKGDQAELAEVLADPDPLGDNNPPGH